MDVLLYLYVLYDTFEHFCSLVSILVYKLPYNRYTLNAFILLLQTLKAWQYNSRNITLGLQPMVIIINF